jgi:ankyrin repeat protein
MFGRVEMLKALIAAGADVSARSANGDTALHSLAESEWPNEERQLDCIEALLEAGADRKAKNDAGETPFDIATRALVRHALRID